MERQTGRIQMSAHPFTKGSNTMVDAVQDRRYGRFSIGVVAWMSDLCHACSFVCPDCPIAGEQTSGSKTRMVSEGRLIYVLFLEAFMTSSSGGSILLQRFKT